MAPLYSILLPVYNGERYLRTSIESVLSQSLREFELVICDDASTDTSAAIVAGYADSRIRLLTNSANRGLFPTLNRLVSESTGDYLRFWAQDDIMRGDCLEAERRLWERHPEIELLYCAVDIIKEPGSVRVPFAGDPTPEVIPPWLSDQISFYHGCMQGNISTVSVRRSTLSAAGSFGSMRFAGDFEMWLRISSRYPIGFLREPVVTLRSHEEQLSKQPGEWRTYINETRPIFKSLLERLPQELQAYARSFERRRRGVAQVQYLMRLLVTKRFAEARDMFRELRAVENTPGLLLLWVATLSGRLARPSARYFDPAVGHEISLS